VTTGIGCFGRLLTVVCHLVSLPADFMVWAVSPDAAFLKGKFIWSNWDVEELKAKKDQILSDPAFLNLGMNGWPYQA
jgi:hypothetical protein